MPKYRVRQPHNEVEAIQFDSTNASAIYKLAEQETSGDTIRRSNEGGCVEPLLYISLKPGDWFVKRPKPLERPTNIRHDRPGRFVAYSHADFIATYESVGEGGA